MNLFRAEEHVRNWSGFKSGTEEGIIELSTLAKYFSGDFFERRSDPDYFSHIKEYRSALGWGEIMKGRPFWLR